jgi:hypothetical protein
MDTQEVINPNHYKQGNIEVIDYILDQEFNYMEGNVIKYVSRYKAKNGLEDLKKAQWYLQKLMLEMTKPQE